MAIKGGQILHVSGGFVIDRIQTGGVTGINVNEDKIEELGNVESIGTVRDIPDLTFELESFDVTTELESILVGGVNDEADGTLFDLAQNVPINVISPFKASGAFTVDGGVVVPYLSLESLSYSFAIGDPTTMTATLRGDSVFYVPGSVFEEAFDGTGAQTVFVFTDGPAYQSVIGSDTHFALSVAVDGVRQKLGTDYTNDEDEVTFTTAPGAGTGNVVVTYGSGVATTYPQTVHPIAIAAQGTLTIDTAVTTADDYTIDSKTYTLQDSLTDSDGNVYTGGGLAQTLLNIVSAMDLSGVAGTDYALSMTAHPSVDMGAFASDDAILTAKVAGEAGDSIATTSNFNAGTNKFDATTLGTTRAGVDDVPAAIRGRDTYVSIDGGNSWLGVQSANVDWSVSLERDEEFGNSQIVGTDFDTPDVSGSVTMKPTDVDALFAQVQAIAGLTGTAIANATEDPAEIDVEIITLDSAGVTTKTWIVPDAKFVVPQLQGSVGSKLEADFTFTSSSGVLQVYKGDN